MLEDAEILRLSVGEPRLFEEIFVRHYDQILRYARQRVGHDVGEEIAARTMMIAFTRRASFDGSSPSARAWLFGIATNLLRHHYRDERVHLGALARLPIDPNVDDIADPQRLDAERARPALIEALGSLSEGDRDAFVLLSLAQLSYPEIADALEIPIGTIRSRIHRARALLRERLSAFEANMDMNEAGSGDPDA